MQKLFVAGIQDTVRNQNLLEWARAQHGAAKAGNRLEVAVDIEAPWVREIANAVYPDASCTLRFASLLRALPAAAQTQDQEFHQDDASDESAARAIVYLTDVSVAQQGAIEFAATTEQSSSVIVGPAGTAVLYPASRVHRGLANRTDAERLALGLAFSRSDRAVVTIGTAEPEPAPAKPMSPWVWAAVAVLLLVLLYKVVVYFFPGIRNL